MIKSNPHSVCTAFIRIIQSRMYCLLFFFFFNILFFLSLPFYLRSISYPESSGFLVSGATPGRLWGHRKNSIFLIGCSVTVSIVLPQKSCGNKIRCPQSLPGVAPLTKKPEDSGYEIDLRFEFRSIRMKLDVYSTSNVIQLRAAKQALTSCQ